MSLRLPLLAGAAFVSVMSAMTGRATATVLVSADLGELVSSARTVVHGRVVEAAPQWLEGRRGIETLVTLAVEDTLKGPVTPAVTFRVPGGQLGPYRSFMPGTPVFAEGEEIVVFLGGEGPAIPHIVGFSQGVYRVRRADGGMRVVRPGIPAPAGETPVSVIRGAASRFIALEQFETEVRALAREAPANARPRAAGEAR